MATTVADALLDGLAAHGVEVCFGVPGVHNLPFWVGAGTAGRPRIVGVRHEGAAGYAADAAARTTRRPGRRAHDHRARLRQRARRLRRGLRLASPPCS